MTTPTVAPPNRTSVPAVGPAGAPHRPRYTAPLPVRVFPFPAANLSNPISLLHLAYVWLNQIISPPPLEPSSHITGRWDPATRSVHAVDQAAIDLLWTHGAFGKGNLSRSEPNWLHAARLRAGTAGSGAADVSERRTAARRQERQDLKWARAKNQQDALDRIKKAEVEAEAALNRTRDVKAPVGPMELLALPNTLQAPQKQMPTASNGHLENGSLPGLARIQAAQRELALKAAVEETQDAQAAAEELTFDEEAAAAVVNLEHLQLMREEAFFLVYSLGIMTVVDENEQAIPTDQLLAHFRQYSYFPPQCRPAAPSASDPFLIHYVVYHHFRSLGWCPRPGMKFGVEWLLYLRTPALDHAEFGLVVLPSYTDSWWYAERSRSQAVLQESQRPWHWLLGLNRVLSRVFKALVLVYVDVPPTPVFESMLESQGIGAALGLFRVREVMVRRWSANRNR